MFTAPDPFPLPSVSSAADINSSCEAFTFSTNTHRTHTLPSRALPRWLGSTSVRVCQLWSLMKRSHKYSTGKYLEAGLRFHHRQMCDSSGRAILLYLPGYAVYPRSNLSGLDECGAAGSILPLTDKQCDFNLNHMNQRLPGAKIKYI